MNVEEVRKVTQVYVFDGDDYLGWDCFEKGVIHLGAGPDADVLLDDEALQPLHARIRPNGVGAILEHLGADGRPVGSRKIGPLDAVTFGRFTVKVRVKAARSAAEPQVRAAEEPSSSLAEVAPTPASVPAETVAVDAATATAETEPLEPAAAAADPERVEVAAVSVEPAPPELAAAPADSEPGEAAVEATRHEFRAPPESETRDTKVGEVRTGEPLSRTPAAEPTPDARVLEVIRLRNGRIVEVRLLRPGEAYEVAGDSGPAPVAENLDGHWFFTDGERRRASVFAKNGRLVPFPGSVIGPRGRAAMPPKGKVVVSDGREEFVLRAVPAPRVSEGPPPAGLGRFLRKSLCASAVFHLLVMVLGVVSSILLPAEAPKPAPVVVELEPPPKPPTPTPEKRVAEPPRPVRSRETVRVTDESKAVAATPRASQAEAPREARPSVESATPGAAAGPGTGESAPAAPRVAAAPPRDVRQSGILRALGVPKGMSLGPNVAMAAVSDVAVPVDASEVGVKVGTLVAKLGKTQVGVSAGGVVATKGSSQVLTGAGTGSGSGSGGTVVGALDKGQTGQRQVRALVSADVKRSASVQGGMSREEVKKVIDQHMDEVTYCYETSLVESPSLMGKMTLEWRIQTAGTVGEVSIQSSTLRSDSLHACIKRAIKGWQFPKPRGAEVIVSYPFIFDVVGF